MYYVDGDYGARKGVDVGMHHAASRPASRTGRSRGSWRRRSGSTETSELAVMCDTFRPLRLTTLARDLDDPSYALSWSGRLRRAPSATAR